MKYYLSVVCALSVLVALTSAAPMPQSDQEGTALQTTRIVNGINDKIRLLRQYCPQLFQVIDNVIQNVTSTAFRVIGRVVLQSGALGIGGGAGGGGGGGGGGNGGSRVSVVLPTFGPDDEDYDEDEDEEEAVQSNSISSTEASKSSSDSSSVTASSASSSIAVGAEAASAEAAATVVDDDDNVNINIVDSRDSANSSAQNEIIEESTQTPLYTSPSSSRSKRDVRKVRAAEEQQANDDQDASASGGNALNDLSNVETDDADRDKRFLPFGGGSIGGSAHAGGGSGNFLFDIIRSTADGAARAAGTVYRMIAGTENLGLGLTATATTSRLLSPQLVAGSGATEESDEKENAPGGVAEIDVAGKGDGLTEGIPGPITRLFVLANRGLANLVQDLILRLAQTSERIVNFKARLITALI